ncbi:MULTISPECIES: glycosyltransferase family 2 protein [Calothrix]|uniref:Glycosyltransferase family 2 protein n=2 Tax=Calothrix TaxID=1186 RepID=A0ABR8AGH0_9CYAN|nr:MULTISPECIES: glycosyltransferase family 2 protein [Calothrix]MBD2199023.1 glycosyltransferase family 2 protein [Calothrix parietina FACHB-288]MBD2227724.1 glycosyltransferase family 2 protein [Calothrix anomala FACHB-343]
MMAQSHILVSIILVNYNGIDVLPDCLNSIETFIDTPNYEIILVDNASSDGSAELVAEKYRHVHLIRQSENRGFGAGNNAGVKVATGEFLFLLNTDTILISNVLPHLIEVMYSHPEVGIIGTKLLNPDGSLQISVSPAIGIKGEYQSRRLHQAARDAAHLKLLEEKFQEIQEVDIVVGAAFFIRASLFNALGGFDENFFMYFEESDLCQRAQNQGYKIIYTPHVSLIHLKGYSVQKSANAMSIEYRRSQLYYYQKHRPLWEQILLRLYLFAKFFREYIATTNPNCLKIIMLLFQFKKHTVTNSGTQ